MTATIYSIKSMEDCNYIQYKEHEDCNYIQYKEHWNYIQYKEYGGLQLYTV